MVSTKILVSTVTLIFLFNFTTHSYTEWKQLHWITVRSLEVSPVLLSRVLCSILIHSVLLITYSLNNHFIINDCKNGTKNLISRKKSQKSKVKSQSQKSVFNTIKHFLSCVPIIHTTWMPYHYYYNICKIYKYIIFIITILPKA